MKCQDEQNIPSVGTSKQEWLQQQTTPSGLWDPKEVHTGQRGMVFLSTLRTEAASQTFQMQLG